MAKKKLHFTIGDKVEVGHRKKGTLLAWYEATITGLDPSTGHYTVAYAFLLPDHGGVEDTVETSHVRPPPPRLLADKIAVDQMVDVRRDDGWWVGVVEGVGGGGGGGGEEEECMVRLKFGEEVVVPVANVRAQLDWIDEEYWVEADRRQDLIHEKKTTLKRPRPERTVSKHRSAAVLALAAPSSARGTSSEEIADARHLLHRLIAAKNVLDVSHVCTIVELEEAVKILAECCGSMKRKQAILDIKKEVLPILSKMFALRESCALLNEEDDDDDDCSWLQASLQVVVDEVHKQLESQDAATDLHTAVDKKTATFRRERERLCSNQGVVDNNTVNLASETLGETAKAGKTGYEAEASELKKVKASEEI